MLRRIPVALAAVALLAACGSDPEPKIAVPTPSTPAPTSASPAVESSAPATETPEAFIERWAQASVTMQNSGEVQAFANLNEATCAPCSKLVDLVGGYYAAGGSISAEPWDIQKIARQSGTTWRVDVLTAPTRVRASRNASETQTDGGAVTFQMTLKSSASSWLMSDYVQLAR